MLIITITTTIPYPTPVHPTAPHHHHQKNKLCFDIHPFVSNLENVSQDVDEIFMMGRNDKGTVGVIVGRVRNNIGIHGFFLFLA